MPAPAHVRHSRWIVIRIIITRDIDGQAFAHIAVVFCFEGQRIIFRMAGHKDLPSILRGDNVDPGLLGFNQGYEASLNKDIDNMGFQVLLTATEVASLLRTSRKVIYGMIRLGQIPGVTRIGRRVLVRRDRLLQFLRERESSVSSLGGAA